ncbi:MAG: hypothetical protein AB7O55_19555 [Lautropia sp.]
MSLDAHAFPMVGGPASGRLTEAGRAPGALLESAAAAIADWPSATIERCVIVVPSAAMAVPLKRALRERLAAGAAAWIPPAIAALDGHAEAADPGRLVRSRFTRLLALAERLDRLGGALPADDGWAGRF